MNDRKAQIRILQNTISSQEQHMKELEERCVLTSFTERRLLHLDTQITESRDGVSACTR
jgi:hypothetical protein